MYQRRDFYRHARYVHGWLSAFAFIVLIFFSVTGLLLNHPEWFTPSKDENTETITLVRQEQKIAERLSYLPNDDIIPLYAGQSINWSLQ